MNELNLLRDLFEVKRAYEKVRSALQNLCGDTTGGLLNDLDLCLYYLESDLYPDITEDEFKQWYGYYEDSAYDREFYGRYDAAVKNDADQYLKTWRLRNAKL